MQTTPFFPRQALALLLCLGAAAQAQTAPSAGLRFSDYLNAVEQHSPLLRSEEQGVESARAGIGIAGIRPDPSLTLGASREQVRTGQPRPTTRNYEISMELETGGKRAARIQSARSQVRLSEAGLEGVRSQLFSDAAQDYTQACRDSLALERKQQTLKALGDVVQANELRRKAGDIGGVEWLQSRVERDRFQAEVVQARAEAQTARLALSVPLGRRLSEVFASDTLQCGFMELAEDSGLEDADALVAQALQSRAEVRIAQAALEHARDNAGLARANRWVNPTLAVGMAAVPMVGMAMGAGQVARARRVAWSGGAMAAALLGVLGLVVMVWPQLWSGIFTGDPAVRAYADLYLRTVGPAFGLFGLGLVLYFASLGAGRVWAPVLAGTVRLLIVVVGGGWLMSSGLGSAQSLFILVAVAMAAYGAGTAWAVWRARWG